MSSDHNTPDDDMPPVSFELRNVSGNADEIKLHSHLLGLEMYTLIRPGDEGPIVEGSHQSLADLAMTLAYVLATLLDSDELDAETRAEAADFVALGADRG